MRRRIRVRIDRIVAEGAGLPPARIEHLRGVVAGCLRDRVGQMRLRTHAEGSTTHLRVAGGAVTAAEARSEQALAGAVADRVVDVLAKSMGRTAGGRE